MKFSKIRYEDLNSRERETYNFLKAGAILADYGFSVMRLSEDWNDADFIAYRRSESKTLRVQLKSRFDIHKKYLGKGLWVMFPVKGDWYLIEHDRLVRLVGKTTPYLESSSWKQKGGGYSLPNVSKELLEGLAEWSVGKEGMRR